MQVSDVVDDAKGWLSRPFNSTLPLWSIFVLIGLFAVLLWIVLDRQDVIKQAQTLVETAVG